MKAFTRNWLKAAALIFTGLAVLSIGSTVGVSLAEEQDGFCATCHLNPERTYVDRARVVAQAYETAKAQGVRGDALWLSGRDAARDLAGSHRAAVLNCVACHRGDQGAGDRAVALLLGARNTLAYISGQFDPNHSGVAQPELVEASCLRCHVNRPELGGVPVGDPNPVTVEGFENHFHVYLFQAEYADVTSIGCVDCHPAHREVPPIVPYFIDETGVVLPACVQCHKEVGEGPLDL